MAAVGLARQFLDAGQDAAQVLEVISGAIQDALASFAVSDVELGLLLLAHRVDLAVDLGQAVVAFLEGGRRDRSLLS